MLHLFLQIPLPNRLYHDTMNITTKRQNASVKRFQLPGACTKYKKRKTAIADAIAVFLSMGYEKDIFGSFAYEFELSH